MPLGSGGNDVCGFLPLFGAGRRNGAYRERASDSVEQGHISAVNEGASLVTQSAGHGAEGGIAPDPIGHGHGSGIEQEGRDLALAGPGPTEIVGVKAEKEPAMAGLGDASGMACREREAQRHRGKTHGFVGTASEQRIEWNM